MTVSAAQKNSLTHESTLEQLRERFEACDQGHVFRFWDQLDGRQRTSLTAQALRICPDLQALCRGQRAAVAALLSPRSQVLEPIEAIAAPECGGDPGRAAAARRRGEEILAAGRVAALVVAGGQGTRLGFMGPKGCFPVGPLTDRTLFELQAQKLRGLARRSGRTIPWYIMTSTATDAQTRQLFTRKHHFGMAAADVFIFQQQMVPAFDFEGHLMLEEPGRIFEGPDGHGGSLTALVSSGALDDMEARGVDTIFYYQVDNPLVKIADPVYLGLHDQAGAEMSAKVVRKVDPMARVGVLAHRDGCIEMLEYTELSDEHRFMRDEDGQLHFWAGNVAIHLLNTGFVRRVAAGAQKHLPFHASAKPIPTVDEAGRTVAPGEPNGYKLERFVFDALGAANAVCVEEISPAIEFSPIKNAQGDESPASARRDLVAQYRRWLKDAGLRLPPGAGLVEIDHSAIDGPEDATAYDDLAEAGDAVRVSIGMSS